jgi:hypothetical protein
MPASGKHASSQRNQDAQQRPDVSNKQAEKRWQGDIHGACLSDQSSLFPSLRQQDTLLQLLFL